MMSLPKIIHGEDSSQSCFPSKNGTLGGALGFQILHGKDEPSQKKSYKALSRPWNFLVLIGFQYHIKRLDFKLHTKFEWLPTQCCSLHFFLLWRSTINNFFIRNISLIFFFDDLEHYIYIFFFCLGFIKLCQKVLWIC